MEEAAMWLIGLREWTRVPEGELDDLHVRDAFVLEELQQHFVLFFTTRRILVLVPGKLRSLFLHDGGGSLGHHL